MCKKEESININQKELNPTTAKTCTDAKFLYLMFKQLFAIKAVHGLHILDGKFASDQNSTDWTVFPILKFQYIHTCDLH